MIAMRCLWVAMCLLRISAGAEIVVEKNFSYRAEVDRCKLDLYRPDGPEVRPCLLWFHGGGMTAGSKEDAASQAAAKALAAHGMLVACVNYRLNPQVHYPTYLEDAAAAYAWVKQNAAAHQGDPRKVFLAGHSAGGYLVMMLGNDPRWLGKQGLKNQEIAGVISLSGQMMTHFTVRAERGIDAHAVVVDDAAPLFYTNQACAPQLILYAEKDMAMRAEENILYLSARKEAGFTQVRGAMIPGETHSGLGDHLAQPGNATLKAIQDFIR